MGEPQFSRKWLISADSDGFWRVTPETNLQKNLFTNLSRPETEPRWGVDSPDLTLGVTG